MGDGRPGLRWDRISTGEAVFPGEGFHESPDSGRRFAADAGCSHEAVNLQPPTTMGDKNPKAKRKLQAQHDAQKRHKADEAARFQRHLYEMRHPEITENPKQ
jgi:hypothetical protein